MCNRCNQAAVAGRHCAPCIFRESRTSRPGCSRHRLFRESRTSRPHLARAARVRGAGVCEGWCDLGGCHLGTMDTWWSGLDSRPSCNWKSCDRRRLLLLLLRPLEVPPPARLSCCRSARVVRWKCHPQLGNRHPRRRASRRVAKQQDQESNHQPQLRQYGGGEGAGAICSSAVGRARSPAARLALVRLALVQPGGGRHQQCERC